MRETTETNAVVRTLQQVDNRFSGMLCKQGGRKGGGAFISQRQTLEWSFCTCESERKINYSQFFVASAMCVDELCKRTM